MKTLASILMIAGAAMLHPGLGLMALAGAIVVSIQNDNREQADERCESKRTLFDPKPDTGNEAIVCADIAARQRLGVAKYGTTVAENPLSLRQWLTAHYEELLDAAIYTRRAIAEIEDIMEKQES